MLTAKPAEAQTIPKPSVPEFSVTYIDNSYDVKANFTLDPKTGLPVLLQEGYHTENNSVGLVIKNQQFTPFYTKNGSLVELYYSIRFKGHLESDWQIVKGDLVGWNNYILHLPFYLQSSHSEYTYDNFSVRTHYLNVAEESKYRNTVGNDPILNFTSGEKVDFQVMALIGYYIKFSDGMTYFGERIHYIFCGENSEWSNTQTVTIGDSVSPSPSPTEPEFPISAVLCLLVVMPLIAIVLLRTKRKQT